MSSDAHRWSAVREARLQAYLAQCDAAWSPAQSMFHNGKGKHFTRDNAEYAVALLQRGRPEDINRAALIFRKLVTHFVTDPTHWAFGVPDRMYQEDPWMLPPYAPWYSQAWKQGKAGPDWNFADFIGRHFGHALKRHAGKLPGDLVAVLRERLGDAAWSVFRRNVGSDYTNIAVYGAEITLLAGEVLGEPRLLDYGRKRLRDLIDSYRHHGQFNEYNSPHYTPYAMIPCETILDLVDDPAARADTRWLLDRFWESLATHFHPPTQQLAGPFFRTYSDHLLGPVVDYINIATGLSVQLHPSIKPEYFAPIHALRDCPSNPIGRFQKLPHDEVTLHEQFIRHDDDAFVTRGVTWLGADACLGSTNAENTGAQRRGLIAYWRTDDDPAVVLRLRLLRDGQDRGSGYGYHAQERNRVLSSLIHLYGSPDDAPLTAQSMIARYELRGRGASGRALDAQTFELHAGHRRAVIHTLPPQFCGQPAIWQLRLEDNVAAVEAVLYQGPTRRFDHPGMGDTLIAAGMELLMPNEAPASSRPFVASVDEQTHAVHWELPVPLPRPGVTLAVCSPRGNHSFYGSPLYPNRALQVPRIPY